MTSSRLAEALRRIEEGAYHMMRAMDRARSGNGVALLCIEVQIEMIRREARDALRETERVQE